MIKPHQFINIAYEIAESSKCTRLKVGAVIVKDNRIVGTGYNGLPSDWDDNTCTKPCSGCPHTIHAEANAIAFAAKSGVSTDGASIFITAAPCINCGLLIIQAGIKKVYFRQLYRSISSDGLQGIQMLLDAGIEVYQQNAEGMTWKTYIEYSSVMEKIKLE